MNLQDSDIKFSLYYIVYLLNISIRSFNLKKKKKKKKTKTKKTKKKQKKTKKNKQTITKTKKEKEKRSTDGTVQQFNNNALEKEARSITQFFGEPKLFLLAQISHRRDIHLNSIERQILRTDLYINLCFASCKPITVPCKFRPHN